MKSFNKTLRIAAVTLSLISSTTVWAGSAQGYMQPITPLQALASELKITREQQDKVFELVAKHQENAPRFDTEPFIELKMKQLDIISQPELDESAFVTVISDMQEYQKAIIINEAKLNNAIYNILTVQQQQKLKTILQTRLRTQ